MFRPVASLAAMLFLACGVPGSDLNGGTAPVAEAPRPEERALTAVPPLTGGTLIITHDGLAIASDPERDLVWVVDLARQHVRGWLTVEVGAEPGRLLEDGD